MEKFNSNKPEQNKLKKYLKIGGLATLLTVSSILTPKESFSQDTIQKNRKDKKAEKERILQEQKERVQDSIDIVKYKEDQKQKEEEIKQKMYEIQIPEEFKESFVDDEGNLRIDWYHKYTEIIYEQKRVLEEDGSDYYKDDLTKMEFFTLDDKIKKVEELLNVKLDKKKIREKLKESRYMSDFFGTEYHSIPFDDNREQKFVKKDGTIDIINAKTAKELLLENNEFKLLQKYDNFPDSYIIKENK